MVPLVLLDHSGRPAKPVEAETEDGTSSKACATSEARVKACQQVRVRDVRPMRPPYVLPLPMAVRRDPVTNKKIPLEPPPDHLEAERQQFINMRILQAASRGLPFDEDKVIDNANVDWKRKQRRERTRYAHTKRLSDIKEPIAPVKTPALELAMEVQKAFKALPTRTRELMALLFLLDFSRSEVASLFKISTNEVSRAKRKALHSMRQALQ
jgi:DNA-directed RNA polymerase specialized sigma subunit, sigma24 homolog